MADEGANAVNARKVYSGRRRILSAPVEITAANVAQVIDRALVAHGQNAADEKYLHEDFLGAQPVLRREKQVRPEINNALVENRAYQICKDRADSLAGEPITYSAHGAGEQAEADAVSDKVQRLNDACIAADKHACDLELVQWMCEVGVGYRLVLPSREVASGGAGRPFVLATLDPRSTFVVYDNTVFHEPLYAVATVVDPETGGMTHTVYTRGARFVVTDGRVTEAGANPLGAIPIIEYAANPERMGIFEAVLSIFDAINEIESNRVDGVAQFVQALMVLENVELEGSTTGERRKTFKELLDLGALQISSTSELPARVYTLNSELNQDQTQTLVDSLYKTALSICGMPFNVGGSASTSDTGAAVAMRDGWSTNESRCKETEAIVRRSERRFIEIALSIMDVSERLGLDPSNVEVKFTRRNYEAIQSKTQVLTTLLGSGKVAPRLAFQVCGLFPDPEDAYDQSMAYVDEQAEASREAQGTGVKANPGGDAGGDNAGDGVTVAGQGTRPPASKHSPKED